MEIIFKENWNYRMMKKDEKDIYFTFYAAHLQCMKKNII
jgi:hypothetical protein